MRAMTELLLTGLLMVGTVAPSYAEISAVAPGFSLPSIYGGGEVSMEDYRGKVVYLDFWASWCGPCRQSLPMLDQLRNEVGADKFEVIAINLDETPEEGLAFLKQFPVSYTVLVDQQKLTPRQYQLMGMPSSFLIDQQGVIRASHTGFRKSDIETIRKSVEALLEVPAVSGSDKSATQGAANES